MRARGSGLIGRHQGLSRFLEDGCLELDTNPVENASRPVCLTRKNALFAGHEVGAENWALLAPLVATCKLNDVNPAAYIAETLETIIDGHPHSRIEDLIPWRLRKASSLRVFRHGIRTPYSGRSASNQI